MEPEVGVLGLVLVWVAFCVLVGRIAVAWRRSPIPWFLLAVGTSPLIALIILLLLGDPEREERLTELEDGIRRRHPDLKALREAAMNEAECPRCGGAINAVTGDGLWWPDAEPWRPMCLHCDGQIVTAE